MTRALVALSRQHIAVAVSPRLLPLLTPDTALPPALEQAAGFGRWWYDTRSGQIALSAAAARFLGVTELHHLHVADCCLHLVADDAQALLEMLCAGTPGRELELRLIDTAEGMRWLRATALPADHAEPGLVAGVLRDITPLKHASMRERLGFELTEYLLGTHQIGDAITNVIQLICRNLGWEWGAYWAMEQSPDGPQLHCRHAWHQPNYNVGAFSAESAALGMAPGVGLVGRVWASGQAEWIDHMATDARFLRRASARECGLWSGYIFPVTYVSEDGVQHRPGVLEFYSSLSRQPEAQLPRLSATIGALIAQTAQRLEKEAEIRHLAQVDELTELSNRSHFHALLNQRCQRAARDGSGFALLFIDLDRFKPINDAFGHDAGNEVLRAFAHRLQALAPPGSSVGRLGGDEFALLVPDADGQAPQVVQVVQGAQVAALADLAEQILHAARNPFTYEAHELTVSASIGVSRFPEHGSTGPQLLRSADAAMYRVKQNGRNGCDLFASSPNALAQAQATLAERLTIEAALHHALHEGHLFLVYQPIFDLASARLHGVEALVRWRRADGELVSPELFIPIAEQSHLIVELGQWVMGQACRDLARLNAAGFKGLTMHVNLAASEFTDKTLPERLRALTASLGIAPSSVSLELTEGMLMRQPAQVTGVMHTLRALGFGISLDDFGMGHSSLSLLKNLPITAMKIDRSFVRDLPGAGRDRAIATTIVELARHLRLSVIAEGVETDRQLAILQQTGCSLIQGYLLGRPMALDELITAFPAGEIRTLFANMAPPLGHQAQPSH